MIDIEEWINYINNQQVPVSSLSSTPTPQAESNHNDNESFITETINLTDQDVEDIIYETPTENLLAAVKQTVSGNISVLNDANILYFRNPPSGVSDTDMWGDLEPVVTINDHVFYRSIDAN